MTSEKSALPYMQQMRKDAQRIADLREHLRLAVHFIEHGHPEHPGHSCGPEGNCNAGCYAYAKFEEAINKMKKEAGNG